MSGGGPGWDGWVAAVFAAIAAVIGSFFGVKVASVEGDKAIQLETKKFELGLIKDALSSSENPSEALKQLDFLIDIGLIENIGKEDLKKITIDRLPTFREEQDIQGGNPFNRLPAPNQQSWSSIEAWLNLHNAARFWDLQTASDSLAILVNASNACATRFAADVKIELAIDGPNGFSQMSAIRSYYNELAGCDLDETNFSSRSHPASIIAPNQPLPLSAEDLPGIYRIPPFRERNNP